MPRKKELPYQTEGDIFATRLRDVMKDRGENQTTLAAKITEQYGIIQRQSISQYMQGQSKPDTVRLTAICKALNVSADYLLGLVDHETPDFDLRKACEYIGLSEEAVKTLRQYLAFEVNDIPDQFISSDSFSAVVEALIKLQKVNARIDNEIFRVRDCISNGTDKQRDECSFDSQGLEKEHKITLYDLWEAIYSVAKEIFPGVETASERLQRCKDSLIDAHFSNIGGQ